MPAFFLKLVQQKLNDINRSDIHLIDCPVSGGTVRAAQGKLTILAAGTESALQQGRELLTLLSEKLYIIPGGIGTASNVKMINQLLAGIHIAAAGEAMGLAAKASLNTRQVYDIILTAAGSSWMFENRVPHMLDNDLTPYSALDIFVKDMVSQIISSVSINYHDLIKDRALSPLRREHTGFQFHCPRWRNSFTSLLHRKVSDGRMILVLYEFLRRQRPH